MKVAGDTEKSYIDLLRRFEALESFHRLGDMSLQGVPIWDVLRYPLFEELLAQKGIRGSSQNLDKQRGLLKSLRKIAVLIFRMLAVGGKKSWLRAPKLQVMIFGHPRRKWDGKFYEDIYVDPLLDGLQVGNTVTVIEAPSEVGHLRPSRTKALYYSDAIEAFATVLSRWPGLGVADSDEENIEWLKRTFEEEFNVPLLRNAQIDGVVRSWRCRYAIYRLIFAFKRPSVVCVVVSSGHCPLIMAAKSLNIPTVELQHGSPGRGKMNYDYTSGVRKRSFPDFFAAFGDFWASRVRFPIPERRIISIGYPYFSRRAESYSKTPKENRLVVLSQLTVADDLIDFASKVSVRLGGECEVVFKPHPSERSIDIENYRRRLESSGVTVVGKEAKLYDLLASAKWQVGVYSTALFEGVGLGAACFILKVGGHHHMRDLIEHGLARYAEVPEDIDLSYTVTDADINHLFMPLDVSMVQKLFTGRMAEE